MTWGDLNPRQQQYMQMIYDTDQENEMYERRKWTRGGRPRPASEWRWIFYGIFPETGNDSPLRRRLKAAQLVDPGTGSTFEALEKRGYIQCRYEGLPDDPFVHILLTPKGRKLVREATGQKPDRLATGQLREWHWRALAEAWKARPEGLNNEWGGDYGRIGWNTWLRLRDYKVRGEERPLIEEYQTWKQVEFQRPGTGTWRESRPVYWLRLSSFGEQYYRENWQHYRELYPNVEAPEPEREPSS
jgi:hypothetical protein